jgi:hypothetical protein
MPLAPRNATRAVMVGPVQIGGGAPIAVQSMAATRTQDVDATVRQVELIHAAGADLIRIAVDSRKDVEALAEVRARTRASRATLSVDLQESYRLAEVVAPHVDKVRYNPGHLHHHEREKPVREKVAFLAEVAEQHDIALRIGVNCGSVDPEKTLKFGADVRRHLDDATTNNWPFSNMAFTRDIAGHGAAAFMPATPVNANAGALVKAAVPSAEARVVESENKVREAEMLLAGAKIAVDTAELRDMAASGELRFLVV